MEITECRRAEERLREREEFLSSIVENIRDKISFKDARVLRFVRFNEAGEILLTYKREDLIGKKDHHFFIEEPADSFTKKDMGVLESGRLYDILDEPIDIKMGSRIFHTKKIPILDRNGKPAYFLGISEDITERIGAEEEVASAK